MNLKEILDSLLISLAEGLDQSASSSSLAKGARAVESQLDHQWHRLILRLQKERALVRAALKPRSLLTEELMIRWQKHAQPSCRESRDISYRYRTQLLQRLHQIDHALLRFKIGDYGLCVKCRSKIGMRRLTADPSMPRCYNCQRLFKGPLILPYKIILKIARQEAQDAHRRHLTHAQHKKKVVTARRNRSRLAEPAA